MFEWFLNAPLLLYIKKTESNYVDRLMIVDACLRLTAKAELIARLNSRILASEKLRLLKARRNLF